LRVDVGGEVGRIRFDQNIRIDAAAFDLRAGRAAGGRAEQGKRRHL